MAIKITFILCLYFGVSVSSLLAQGTLTIEVTNIKKTIGLIRVGLFDNEKDFLKNAYASEVVKASGNKVEVTFSNLPPGEYGISVIHDENDNGELDTNFMGVPKEGFGFGNDEIGMFGPPSFDKAKIKWEGEDMHVCVKVKYF